MGQGVQNSIYNLIQSSENYRLSFGERSSYRHRAIEYAERTGVHEDWVDVGEALIRAAEINDLTPQVSDHFVRDCPDEVFASLPRESAACKFYKWRKKSELAHA